MFRHAGWKCLFLLSKKTAFRQFTLPMRYQGEHSKGSSLAKFLKRLGVPDGI
jgi:hypothetical protein